MQLIKYILLVFFAGCVITVSGQSKKFSPVKGETMNVRDQPTDRKKIGQELKYAQSIFRDSISSALNIVEKNLFIAVDLGYRSEEAQAYSILGTFNQELENYKLAISNYNKSIKIYSDLKKVGTLIEMNDRIGDCYKLLKQNEQAITYWKKSEQQAKSEGLTKPLIGFKLKIGMAYIESKNYKKAKPFFDNALKLAEELNDEPLIVEAKIGLGKIEELKGQDKKAEAYYYSAHSQAKRIDSDELTNNSLNSLSDLYENQQNLSQSYEVQQQAYDYNAERGNTKSAIWNSTNMANTLVELGEKDEAIEILNETSKLLEEEDNSFVKRNYYKTISDVYEKTGDPEKAAEFRNTYHALIDSFRLLENQKKELIAAKNSMINFTENKILLLEKDREINEKTIKLLQQEQVIKNEAIKRQKTITYILIFGLLVIAIMAFFIYRNNKQKQISNQLLTLKSLRNQMNPHFIFNSLNSVNGFIAKKDERSANKYLSEFSKLMREVLEYSQNDFISLAKEIEVLKLYLNLEHFRFKSHFDYRIDYPKNTDLEKYQIPPMLLQPFIENAIWHGLRYKSEKGQLDVIITEKDNVVEIKITDNGIGRAKSKLAKTANQKKMKSTGIKNVKNRLEIIKSVFQKELNITINDLNPETKEGTEVKVELFV